VSALYAVIGALICLYRRDTKKVPGGQSIDVSLLEGLYMVLSQHAVSYDQLGINGKRTGNRTSGSAPRNTYPIRDERWIVISGSTQIITESLFRVIWRPDLIAAPRFKTNRDRVTNVEAARRRPSARRTQSARNDRRPRPRAIVHAGRSAEAVGDPGPHTFRRDRHGRP